MLMRFDPFEELDRWVRQTAGARPSAMPMDAYRQGDHFTIHLDLPGVDPTSIDLTVEKDVLTISAERRWAREEGQEVLVSERPQGSFSRQLFLSDGLDADHIEATYEHGVLTVRIPVAESAKPRKVAVTARDEGAKAIESESHAA